jgi:uncharacterized protein YndB with AHSA1/START domain
MELKQVPVSKPGMLIRRPAADVFNAFVDPSVTTKFWFTKSTGPLTPGARVQWGWDMYGVSSDVVVKAVEPDKRILIEWTGNGVTTLVEWLFQAVSDRTTFVRITHSGFAGDGDRVVQQALDSIGGFTLVLAGAKAFLEHGVELGLIGDRYPKGVETH